MCRALRRLAEHVTSAAALVGRRKAHAGLPVRRAQVHADGHGCLCDFVAHRDTRLAAIELCQSITRKDYSATSTVFTGTLMCCCSVSRISRVP